MVVHIPRQEFLEDYWDYRPGEHVNIIGPTGNGKTFLKKQLVKGALRQNPQLSYTAMMPKPVDPTTTEMAQEMGFRIKRSYPFTKRLWEDWPRGHVLWPLHIRGDEKANREHLSEVFGNALADLYIQGDCIVDCDDVYLMAAIYGLNSHMESYWTAGRALRSGLWTANQKPSGTARGGVSSFSYSQPTHLFLSRDGDKRNIQRFGEIGMGLDHMEIESIVRNLRVRQVGDSSVSEFLHLDRRWTSMAVVGID